MFPLEGVQSASKTYFRLFRTHNCTSKLIPAAKPRIILHPLRLRLPLLQQFRRPVLPFSPATISSITLCLSRLAARAPCHRSVRTTLVWPFAAVTWWRGVERDEPIIGAGVWGRGISGSWSSVGGVKHSHPPLFNLTTRSWPPDDAACNGSTPSSTELMGWPWERALVTRPTLPSPADSVVTSYFATRGERVLSSQRSQTGAEEQF